MISWNWITLKPIFNRIWTTMEKSFPKWATDAHLLMNLPDQHFECVEGYIYTLKYITVKWISKKNVDKPKSISTRSYTQISKFLLANHDTLIILSTVSVLVYLVASFCRPSLPMLSQFRTQERRKPCYCGVTGIHTWSASPTCIRWILGTDKKFHPQFTGHMITYPCWD